MSAKDAAALVIRNFAMLEEIYKVYMENIGPEICTTIDKLVKEWAVNLNWEVASDIWEDDTCWFAPEEFKIVDTDNNESWLAKYNLIHCKNGKKDESEDYNYWISALLGIVETQVGFSFAVDRDNIGGPKAGKWKDFGQNHNSYSELMKSGFIQLNDGNWFIPFRLDPELLADAYLNDNIEDAMQPIIDVLEIIKIGHPIFSGLLMDAKRNEFK